MKALELFNLKPGTLIKGLHVLPRGPHGEIDMGAGKDLRDRPVTLRTEGWLVDPSSNLKVVQTLFTAETPTHLTPWSGKEVLLHLTQGGGFEQDVEYPPVLVGSMSFKQYNLDDLIGVHLGEFYIHTAYKCPSGLGIFSKILTCEGLTGYLMLDTSDIRRSDLLLL